MAEPNIPNNYRVVQGSERHPSPGAKLLAPADPNETFTVTISIRRRPDGSPLPSFNDYLAISPKDRPRLSQEEFSQKFGASPEDIDKVVQFSTSHGLSIVETNSARRTVVVSGTVDQFSQAFAVTLSYYEHDVVAGASKSPTRENYRGRDGAVYVPSDLETIVVGVFGLDNRRITKRNQADPPNTGPLSTHEITQLYNFPTNTAGNQAIAILSEAGFMQADILATVPGITASQIRDIPVDASNDMSPDPETTQDLCIAALAAPGATVAAYFTTYSQQGWVDLLSRVIHPNLGGSNPDPICSVLSSSFYVENGDDATDSVSLAWMNAVTQSFQDAAIQGVTICIASGDTGSQSKINDGNVHVQYPASDPWVLSVGGTTIGNVNGSSFDEYVWNDFTGASGGGVSGFFAKPSYQNSAAVPARIGDGFVGRGVPDVSGNASPVAAYSGIYMGGSQESGNGTSASSPLWAGLIAVINAAIGFNVGFVNPAIYAIGSSGFRDITPVPGASDNGVNITPGYPVTTGWDACTGWGSPNGQALLNALKAIYTPNMYFIVDKSTFGLDEVSDVISVGGGLFSNAFWIVIEGFSISSLGNTLPVLSGPFATLTGVSVFVGGTGPQYERPGDFYTPQRIRIPYDIIFNSSALASDFPVAGSPAITDLLGAVLTVGSSPLAAEAAFELTAGADPYFTNVDAANNNVFYLSQDLRVFSCIAGQEPLDGAAPITNTPYQSIQDLLSFLNGQTAYTTPGADPLNFLPGQTGYETGDSSVTPLSSGGAQNYNFAIARVRLQGPAGSAANNVRVFFRLFVAVSCDTEFLPASTYKSTLGTTGTSLNLPVFPLASGTGILDYSGQSLQTIPFFATDATGSQDYSGSNPHANIRTMTIPMGSDKVWAYFGCYLDVYNSTHQSLFPGTHHCLVAEIAYDDAPIINPNGVTMSPESSDKLAQRNLNITTSGNPSFPETHRIPQAFDTRPSKVASAVSPLLDDYPDELMIDWGNVPAGSTAHIYWPQVNADSVVALASRLYGAHPFSATDANTISCQTTQGVAYLPVPVSNGNNLAGLFTVDLPNVVHIGQEFNITVRRVTSRQLGRIKAETFVDSAVLTRRKIMTNWRYITGTFQVKIPVDTDEKLLGQEETTLAILKWRAEHMTPEYRWFPVLQRYIAYVAGRVKGFGGDPTKIVPSLGGETSQEIDGCKGDQKGSVGKVSAIVYDKFGDFVGFKLETDLGIVTFKATEPEIERLIERAWAERILLQVTASPQAPHNPNLIEYLRKPATV